jgi:proline dehydrogenase
MPSFDNTEIAFSGKSDKDLLWAKRLFKLIGNSTLVSFGEWGTKFALNIGLPIKGIIKKTIFKQFCGGETIGECEKTITHLAKYQIGTILDYSVEGKKTNEEFDLACEELLKAIEKANKDDRIPFSVFKVTGLGSFEILEKRISDQKNDPEFQKILNRVDQLCKASFNTKTPIFIDAEESWIQNTIDWIANQMMEKYNKEQIIVYNTLQMYRHDRLDYLFKCFEHSKKNNYKLGLKIVRGAYMEKERERAEKMNYPSPINDTKQKTDDLYDKAIQFCLENYEYIAICAGTHNEKSSKLLADNISKLNIPKNHPNLYFSQLLGMSDHISFNLSHEGYNVAKYVPYGPVKEVIPYLTRRAQENTSVGTQTSRELGLIEKEIKRRKSYR